MTIRRRPARPAALAGAVTALIATPLTVAGAQRDARPVAAAQAFDAASCRPGCAIDSITIDIERGRRAQAGAVTATLVMIDTVALARRGAPPAPKEQPVAVWIACDSTPCGAAMLVAKLNDRRIDDARVQRRSVATWSLAPALLSRLVRTPSMQVMVDSRTHLVSAAMLGATRTLLEPLRASVAPATYSPRMQLYIATFATFGVPGDSTLAEDVGTATEPLMMVSDPNTSLPTRVTTLVLAGRGAGALPLLVQDDATGAAPLFGIGEAVTIALPGRVGRRGAVAGRVVARQRVEALRDTCQKMKLWTYLLTLSPTDLAAAQRGAVASPRAEERVDRWSGTAVREAFPPRMTPAEQRQLTASRTVVGQFVRERAASGVRERDVQVLALLPKGAGLVTNFGVFTKDPGGSWHFPTLTLRTAACPAN